jgi:tRNA/tmRNA/rRNA uracil-C5-methylase (TrmA/RlmC/RlmD family)
MRCHGAMEQDALTMLSAYDQMRGQYNAMFECAEHLKRENPNAWETYFSRAAKRRRARARLNVRGKKQPIQEHS